MEEVRKKSRVNSWEFGCLEESRGGSDGRVFLGQIGLQAKQRGEGLMHDGRLDQPKIVQIDEMLEIVVLQLLLQHQTTLGSNELLQEIRKMAVRCEVVIHHVRVPQLQNL